MPAQARNGWDTFNQVGDAAWRAQSLEQLLDGNFPTLTTVTQVTTRGRKGTPTKHVLHVALAAAFGAVARHMIYYGDIDLAVKVDLMKNQVTVVYTTIMKLSGYALGEALGDGAAVKQRVVDDKDVTGRNLLGAVKQMVQTNANLVVPEQTAVPAATGGQASGPGVPGIGDIASAAYSVAASIVGYDTSVSGAVAVSASSLADFVKRNFDTGLYNLGMNRILWGDPKSAQEADNLGFLGREVIRTGLPPVSLFPTPITNNKPNFPEPYRSMLYNREEIVTRYPFLADGKTPAGNPLPPRPRNRNAGWEYGKPAPVTAHDVKSGYDFDLRSLVAQALSDPGLELNRPDTDLSLTPYAG